LTAPVTGVVQQRYVEPGETVGPAVPVLQIEEMGKLVVRVGATEDDLRRLSNGGRATISRSAEGAPIAARVTHVAPVPDPADGLFSIEVAPDTKASGLVPGSLVTVAFEDPSREQRVSIPLEAIVERSGKTGVFLLESSEPTTKVKWKAVQIGRVDGRDVWLSDGLSGGERLVAEGAYFLENGETVRIARKQP
jgi:membrane fusion protein (multidrug efflux system)